jgi:EAL domain-containing protein (putative c-di-GMP-specific phosphodiesterase class I)
MKSTGEITPRQFAEPDFVQTVLSVLAETGLPSGHLQLEVTEGLLLEPTPQTLQKIDSLVAAGVRLAVDDFGMGYSSLAYLKRFPLHTLKIDRMFVRDLPQARHDAAIVRAIVDLGHGLGLKITAEGVETGSQFHELRRLGCDSMQGYLFARPTTAAEMTLMLERPGGVAERTLEAASGWSTTMHAML